MELHIKELKNSSGFTLDYLFKLLRESNVNNRIILFEDDLINLRNYIKKNCTTYKRYRLYLVVNSFLINNNNFKVD